ncbi:MAG: 50S ribosomal protein L23 [Xanthomonadaceae bacterium]|nr:50S ribosomal protein L23 [Rhodospirillaceae bacterium]NIA17816.1 50S ribosomal protein L23 [Xanthomonadaceae bacterium]
MSFLDKIKKTIKGESKEDKKSERDIKKEVKKGEKGKKKDIKKIREEKKAVKKEIKARDVKKEKIKGIAYRILVRPLITEKITSLGVFNQYVFAVSTKANKIDIKKAIQEVYGIKPISVNIINMRGRKVRSGKVSGETKKWKKAIITLKKGEKIEVYKGV